MMTLYDDNDDQYDDDNDDDDDIYDEIDDDDKEEEDKYRDIPGCKGDRAAVNLYDRDYDEDFKFDDNDDDFDDNDDDFDNDNDDEAIVMVYRHSCVIGQK